MAQTVGYLPEDVIDHLAKNGKLPFGAAMVVRDKDIVHWLRDNKANRGAAIPLSIANTLPKTLRSPDAILLDKNDLILLKY